MATYYWVGGTGTWSATGNTHFATSSGGTAGALTPGTADTVIFDSASNASGAGASYTVTRTATAAVTVLQMANPSAGTLTFAGSSSVLINNSTSGSLTVSAGVNWTNTGLLTIGSGAGTYYITVSPTLPCAITFSGLGSGYYITGQLITSSIFTLSAGTIQQTLPTYSGYIKCNSFTQTAGTCAANGTIEITGGGTTNFVVMTCTGTSFTSASTLTFLYTYAGAVGNRIINCTRAYGIHIIGPASGSATDSIAITASNTLGALQFNSNFNGTFTNTSAFNIDTTNVGTNTISALKVDITSTMTWSATSPGAITFLGTSLVTSTDIWFVLPNPIIITSTGTVKIDGVAINNILTLTKGTYTPTALTVLAGFATSGTTARTLDLSLSGGTIYINNVGSIWNISSYTGLTFTFPTGTTRVTVWIDAPYAGSATINNAATAASSGLVDFYFVGGSYTLTITSGNIVGSLDFTGFNATYPTGFIGSVDNTAFTVGGDFSSSSGMVWASGSSTITMSNTTGTGVTNTISCKGNTINSNVTFSAVVTTGIYAGSWSNSDNTNVSGLVTHSNGNLNLGSYIANFGAFLSSGTRTMTSPSSFQITGTASSTPWSFSSTSYTGDGTSVYLTSTATNLTSFTITNGNTAGISDLFDFYFTGGSYNLTITSSNTVNSLNFTGYSGILANNALNIHGNLILSPTMTWSGATAVTLNGAGGSIICNNCTINSPITINSSTGSWTLGGAFLMGSAYTLTLTSGSLNSNGYNVTCGFFSCANSANVSLNMSSSLWTLTGSGGNAWSLSSISLLTFSPSTSTILLTGTTPTFAGGGATYNNLVFGGSSGSSFTFTGANTFNFFGSIRTVSFTIIFTSSTITTIKGWGISGSAGNLVSINSTGAAAATMNFTGGVPAGSGFISMDYMTIAYSTVTSTGGALWYAGANSTLGTLTTGWLTGNKPNNAKFLEFF